MTIPIDHTPDCSTTLINSCTLSMFFQVLACPTPFSWIVSHDHDNPPGGCSLSILILIFTLGSGFTPTGPLINTCPFPGPCGANPSCVTSLRGHSPHYPWKHRTTDSHRCCDTPGK